MASVDIDMALHLDPEWTVKHIDYCIMSLLQDKLQLLNLIKQEPQYSPGNQRRPAPRSNPGGAQGGTAVDESAFEETKEARPPKGGIVDVDKFLFK